MCIKTQMTYRGTNKTQVVALDFPVVVTVMSQCDSKTDLEKIPFIISWTFLFLLFFPQVFF